MLRADGDCPTVGTGHMCVGFLYTVIDQIPISLWFYNGVQEGDGAIFLIVLHCKLHGRVNTVNML